MPLLAAVLLGGCGGFGQSDTEKAVADAPGVGEVDNCDELDAPPGNIDPATGDDLKLVRCKVRLGSDQSDAGFWTEGCFNVWPDGRAFVVNCVTANREY